MKKCSFKIKKRYILSVIAILILITIFTFTPIKEYLKMLQVYHKFQSEIIPSRDSIFHESKNENAFIPMEFNEQTRLYYLCKVWGFSKYYGEYRTFPKSIDSLLILTIPKTIASNDKQSLSSVFKTFISPTLDTQRPCDNPYLNLDDYALLNHTWMHDTICLYNGFREDANTIWKGHAGSNPHFVYNKAMVGNIRLKNETSYPDFPDETIRLLGLFRYWNVINYFYVYKNFLDEDWDKVLYEAIPTFRNADTKEKYHRAIYWLTNKQRDTHASYPPTIDPVVFGAYRPNFRMMLIDSMFVISKIRLAEHDDKNFEIGDIVIEIDNCNIHQLADSLSNYVCGGNYWSNQNFISNALLSRRDSITDFKLIRKNDTLIVQSKNKQVWDIFQSERQIERDNEKNILYKWINDNVAYFDLRSATSDNFGKNYKQIKSATAIILDLRCYPDTDLILNLTNAFVPPNSFFAYITYPDARYPGMVRYNKSSSENIGHKDFYKGKLIVLVNENTQSYSEYITMALQANPKTIVIGNSSSGSDGNITTFEFPGGVKTIYSGVGVYYPDFRPTQRVGIKIDHVVEPCIESIKQKIDNAYQKAVEIAKQ